MRLVSVVNSISRMNPSSVSGIGLLQAQPLDRHHERHILLEPDQLARKLRLQRKFREPLAPLGLLDLVGPLEQRVEVAVLVDQLGGGLDADARHARHIVGGIAGQRLHVDDLVGRHTELLPYLVGPDAARWVFMVSSMVMPGLTSCIRSLSEETMVTSPPRSQRLHGVGGNEIIGLVALLLDAGDVEGFDGVADQPELRDQLLGHGRAVRLVILVDFVAEGLLAVVEDDGNVGRVRSISASPGEASRACRRSRDGAHGHAVGACV